jgi:hypothetical protein
MEQRQSGELAWRNPDGSFSVQQSLPKNYHGIHVKDRVLTHERVYWDLKDKGYSDSYARIKAEEAERKGLNRAQIMEYDAVLDNVSMVTSHGVVQKYPGRNVDLKVISVDTTDLIDSDTEKRNLSHRADHFVDLMHQGKTIPPPLVHKLPNGKYEILDGHARIEAYRRMGVKQIPVVENFSFGQLGRGIKSAFSGLGKGLKSGVSAPSDAPTALKIGSQLGSGSKKAAVSTGHVLSGVSKGLRSGLVAPKEEKRGVKVGSFLGAGARQLGSTAKTVAKSGMTTAQKTAKEVRHQRLKQQAKSKDPRLRKAAKKKLREEFPEDYQ